MSIRTDLAVEITGRLNLEKIKGITVEEYSGEKSTATIVNVINKEGAEILNKPIGKYITLSIPEFSHSSELLDGRLSALTECIKSLLPTNCENFLVVGLGNSLVTPDALGPYTARNILATRHLEGYLNVSDSAGEFNTVSVISTGVLGQTGIETREYIKAVCNSVSPQAVIIVDALASRSFKHLGKTIQLTNTGISPGSGVGNCRKEISKEFLGVPVIAIGVPTVIDGKTFMDDALVNNEDIGADFFVTPRDIDTIISRASSLLGLAVNCACNPLSDPKMFLSVM